MAAGIWFSGDGEAATRGVIGALSRRGFRVVRSFDLRSAVAGHSPCACPHHGPARCNCQFNVLLAYSPSGAQTVITVHSRDGQVEVQIVAPANAPAAAGALDPVALAVLDAAGASQMQASPGRTP